MDYAKEYDRMVEQSNSQQIEIERLKEELAEATLANEQLQIEVRAFHIMFKAHSEPVAHKWDGSGERCVICGDKDWMGTSCTTQPAQDAERYRWLRDKENFCHDLWLHHKLGELVGEELDALIDEAIDAVNGRNLGGL